MLLGENFTATVAHVLDRKQMILLHLITFDTETLRSSLQQ